MYLIIADSHLSNTCIKHSVHGNCVKLGCEVSRDPYLSNDIVNLAPDISGGKP